ncbi:MAG TPA: hypothetical protein VFD84_01140 [Candidatus Binatia bacterium]|jgi:septal ring factor EnvC (AmiA/AmiB activator)|nr:hypothetical protein [Candidatus Binatia bacterium]
MGRSSTGLVLASGLVLGAGAGVGAGYLLWRRPARALEARIAAVEAEAAQVQGERERLHRELSDIVRERREMANTAERLRAQVEEQLHRLETLAEELAPSSSTTLPADQPP